MRNWQRAACALLLALMSQVSTAEICIDSKGKKVLQDYPCGLSERPVNRPSGQSTPAPAAVYKGRSGQSACLAILADNDLTAPFQKCSLGDQACVTNAQKESTAIYSVIVSHPAWKLNNCDAMVAESNSRSSTDVIAVSVNDEFFVINGNKYKAKTYCFGQEVGDRVEFIEGSRFGACTSARWVNRRNNRVCAVWCE